MDKVNKAISESLKTGQYYIDSKNWYLRRFTYPIIERSYLAFIALVFSIILFELLVNISVLFPTTSKLPIAMKIEDSLNNVAILKKILVNELTPEEEIKKYLLKRYVENKETYNFDNIQSQLNIIKNSSLIYIYKDFHNYMSVNNPDSPVLYQKYKSRNIEIINIDLDALNNAKVEFKAIENNNLNKTSSESVFIANISFQIEDISDIIKSHGSKNLNFLVTEYKTEQIR